MGPGYYKNENDITTMKKEFQTIVDKNRLKNETTRIIRPSVGGFGSTTSRDEGSSIQTALKSKAYGGVAGEYYNESG